MSKIQVPPFVSAISLASLQWFSHTRVKQRVIVVVYPFLFREILVKSVFEGGQRANDEYFYL